MLKPNNPGRRLVHSQRKNANIHVVNLAQSVEMRNLIASNIQGDSTFRFYAQQS